ncbi:ABC transporter ATP-binding protein [Parvimonas sp. D2]|uniref:ABC transporter ATP-binding protein n=1 Tax=unclassified Parvimonas TaxID=1151464 RepID=UPI002B49A4A0|nr:MULTISPECIES: ABC transporter ATP-binding protein [unclassified Parvimonas]MEB3012168.1 ABC transporter ATP-binding protein [Parvimonas sp. D2]MEB3087399.1 ABC transporter ATP-binding protein [Parvimonas sp. D4]
MVKTLSKSIREYKKDSIMSVIYIVFEVIMECIIPFILANLVNGIRSNIPIGDLFKQGLILVVMAMLSLAFGILAGKKSAVASAGFARNLRKDIFEKVQGFSFENIDSFSNSSLLTRLTTDVTNVQNAYMMTIRMAIRSPFMFVFSFVMSFIMGGKLAFIFVIVVPILLIGLAFILIKAMKIFKKIFYKYDDMNNTIQENIKAIRLVKSLVREDFEIEKFDKVASEVKHDFTIAEKIISLYAPLMQFCLYVDTVLILFLGSYVIVAGINPSFNVGQISALMTYSFMILSSLMMFSMVIVMLTMAMESSKRISEVLNTESTITDEKSLHKVLNSGEIEFKNVIFRYSEDAKENVINDVSFKIPSGSTVGIIGATGSGKSTLVQLIPRLYNINSGEILIDNINIENIDIELLREEVGVVLQKNTLFSGTIRENLKWGNKNATDEDLDLVCNIAQATEIINKMPNGYDEYIEQGGANLSGGQKQRLCIARALLKKPKILIFDDSTSAVDTKTDELIRRGLQSYMPETTKIIIAQRILSVQNADIILVIEKGKVVASGNHETLVRQEGLYRDLYLTQGGVVDEK